MISLCKAGRGPVLDSKLSRGMDSHKLVTIQCGQIGLCVSNSTFQKQCYALYSVATFVQKY